MRLIDADTLKTDYFVPSTSTGTVSTQYVSLFQILNAPTIDAVEVVRCQNCKFYCGEETYTNHRICKMWNEEVFANGYCYMGKRKEQNDETSLHISD